MMAGESAELSAVPIQPKADRGKFARLVTEAYNTGHRRHGDLGMEPERFGSRLLSIARKYLGPQVSWGAVFAFIGKLHVEDLYLSSACAQHSEAAWHQFSLIYRKCIQDLFRYVALSTDAALELADLTLIDMFLPDRSGQSRIASYDGRSSLVTWLRVIVSHRAINERQRMWNRMQRVEPSLDIADASALRTVESRLRTGRYERVFNDSLQSVCSELSAQERLILLWRYEEGLQLGQIARLMGIHQSTVTRQLERLLKRMRGEVISALVSKYQLSPAAIEECLSVIVESSSHSISVLGLLKQTPEGETALPPARRMVKEQDQRLSRIRVGAWSTKLAAGAGGQ